MSNANGHQLLSSSIAATSLLGDDAYRRWLESDGGTRKQVFGFRPLPPLSSSSSTALPLQNNANEAMPDVGESNSTFSRLRACLPTEDLKRHVLLSTEQDVAAFESTANEAFHRIKDIARQCLTNVVHRQALSSSSSTSSTTRDRHVPNNNGKRIRLVATERRFITALHNQSQLELQQHCLETRDRTVAESFSGEHGATQQTRSIGDARLEQIRADFYDGFDPHEGQIALFEMLLEQLASRIYAEEWERDWRAICERNHWHNVRLRLGFSASIMPRRTGKTTVGARSALVFAMNIPRWKGVIIGTSVETASYTIDELDKQYWACSRAVRDFKYVHTAGAIALAPYSDLMDIRTWITIPGEVRRLE